jgi:hypothetical protein
MHNSDARAQIPGVNRHSGARIAIALVEKQRTLTLETGQRRRKHGNSLLTAGITQTQTRKKLILEPRRHSDAWIASGEKRAN